VVQVDNILEGLMKVDKTFGMDHEDLPRLCLLLHQVLLVGLDMRMVPKYDQEAIFHLLDILLEGHQEEVVVQREQVLKVHQCQVVEEEVVEEVVEIQV